MDGPEDYYAKWNKPDTQRKTNTIWSHLNVDSNEQITNKIETEA